MGGVGGRDGTAAPAGGREGSSSGVPGAGSGGLAAGCAAMRLSSNIGSRNASADAMAPQSRLTLHSPVCAIYCCSLGRSLSLANSAALRIPAAVERIGLAGGQQHQSDGLDWRAAARCCVAVAPDCLPLLLSACELKHVTLHMEAQRD